jgi:hypothetical protein
LLLVATAFGCHSRDSASLKRDMATARQQPRWVETIAKSHVITTLEYTNDLDECHARGRTQRAGSSTSRVLDVVIEPGAATAAQSAELKAAVATGAQRNVTVNVHPLK